MANVKLVLSTFLLLFCCFSINAQTKEQIGEWLDSFLVVHFDSCFAGRQYIEGSLTVSTLEPDEVNNVIKVRGKHSYRGQYIPFFGRKTYSNVDFKAEVSVTNSGLKIKFWKWYEPGLPTPWEGPCIGIISLTDYEE